MGLHQPRITAIDLHLGNLPVKARHDLRVLRVLQAHQNMQAVFTQRLGRNSTVLRTRADSRAR